MGCISLTLVVSQGTVLTPTMDHTLSIQPAPMMGPLTQQLSHLTLSSTGTVSHNPSSHSHQKVILSYVKISPGSFLYFQYIPANTAMQGTYIPQYTQVPPVGVSVEVRQQTGIICSLFIVFRMFLTQYLDSAGKWNATGTGHYRSIHRTFSVFLPAQQIREVGRFDLCIMPSPNTNIVVSTCHFTITESFIQ